MKSLFSCFMLLLVCSCQNNFDNSVLDDSKKTNRSEEILKIMREYYIHEIETADLNIMPTEYKEELLSEVSKMKEDYYYIPDYDWPLSIPGPDWEIKGPLPFDNAPTYGKLREKCKEGDELYFYRSDEKSWLGLYGREGYVIIRDNKVVAMLDTIIN